MQKTAKSRMDRALFNIVDSTPHPVGSKPCTKCRIIKDAKFFSKCSITKDKLQSWCKDCSKPKAPKSTAPVLNVAKPIFDVLETLIPENTSIIEDKLSPLYIELKTMHTISGTNNKLRTNKHLSDLLSYHELHKRAGLNLLTIYLESKADGLYRKQKIPKTLREFVQTYLKLLRESGNVSQESEIVLQQLMEKVDSMGLTISRLLELTTELNGKFEEWSS